ncbi:MAG: type II toxin-antitoxin system RelE/ParE family toxin [Phycisphaerae bacterium]
MSYQLIIKPAAEREIGRLPRPLQRRVVDGIARIQQEPRGPGTVKLAGTKATYRIRVGEACRLRDRRLSTFHFYNLGGTSE